MTRLYALFLAMFIAACQTPIPPDGSVNKGITVPYDTSSGLFVIDVTINDKGPFPFILDTGASTSVIYESTAQKLGLKPVPGERLTVHGLIDSAERPIVFPQTMGIGTLLRVNPRLVVLKDRHSGSSYAGIIGLDTLAEYALIFNPDTKQLTFVHPQDFSTAPYRGWNTILLRSTPFGGEDYGLRFTTIRYGLQQTPALIDTGAELSLMNLEAAKGRAVTNALRKDRRRWELEGAVGTYKPRFLVRFATIRLGGYPWHDKLVYIIDFGTISALTEEPSPLVIAGADFFRDRHFVLNMQNNQLLVKRSGRREDPDQLIYHDYTPSRLQQR